MSEINDNECSARVGNYTVESASGIHIDGKFDKKKAEMWNKIKDCRFATSICFLFQNTYKRDNVSYANKEE